MSKRVLLGDVIPVSIFWMSLLSEYISLFIVAFTWSLRTFITWSSCKEGPPDVWPPPKYPTFCPLKDMGIFGRLCFFWHVKIVTVVFLSLGSAWQSSCCLLPPAVCIESPPDLPVPSGITLPPTDKDEPNFCDGSKIIFKVGTSWDWPATAFSIPSK